MEYKIIIHVYLGDCGNWNGKRRSYCYGSSKLIFAPKYRRYHNASFRIGYKNFRLSMKNSKGWWRVPKSICCDLKKVIQVEQDRGFTQLKQDKIFKRIDNRRAKFKNSYKYGKEEK